MAYDDFTRHQQGIIKRYYRNLDSIQLQKLGELITELYLAEGKKQERLWKQAETVMTRLEVSPSRIEHLLNQRNPALVATLLQELQSTSAQ